MNNKNLTTFKTFVLQNFPFIEDTFDSINNYQLFCKVVEYLNKVIGRTNEISVLASELENFTINYFKKLDVNNEINDKIDNMVKDGTMNNLLNPLMHDIEQRTLQNSVDIGKNNTNLNNKVTKNETNSISMNMLSNEVKESMTGGTVAVVGENSIDYTNIKENSVDIFNLASNLQDKYEKKFTTINLTAGYAGWARKHINTKKLEIADISNTMYQHQIYNLEKGQIYQYIGYDYASLKGLIVVDSQDNVILQTSEESVGNGLFQGSSLTFRINNNGCKAYINTLTYITNSSSHQALLQRMAQIKKLEGLSDIYSNFDLKFTKNVNAIKTIENAYMTRYVDIVNNIKFPRLFPNFTQANTFHVHVYSMNKGKTYKLHSLNDFDSAGIVITNLNLELLYNSASTEHAEKNGLVVDYEFYATTNGFIFITESVNKELATCKEFTPFNSENINKLKRKLIAFNGDSICKGEAQTGGYPASIQKFSDCEINNIAVGGGTIAYGTKTSAGVDKYWICDTISNMPNNADIICLQGGWNDYWNSVLLGNIKLTGSDMYTNNLDKTTFYGALESMFRESINKWLNKPITFILCHKNRLINVTPNSIGLTFEDYSDAIKITCKKYGIYLINIQDNVNFITAFDNLRTQYTNNADGTHPLTNAYDKYYAPYIISEMEKLII